MTNPDDDPPAELHARRLATLSAAINETYGWFDRATIGSGWIPYELRPFLGTPAIDMGPCGPFARVVLEECARSGVPASGLAFVMSGVVDDCCHVAVRLEPGLLFDGGYGVVTDGWMIERYASVGVVDPWIDDPEDIDDVEFARRCGGLDRSYPLCPGFSVAGVRTLVRRHLGRP